MHKDLRKVLSLEVWDTGLGGIIASPKGIIASSKGIVLLYSERDCHNPPRAV